MDNDSKRLARAVLDDQTGCLSRFRISGLNEYTVCEYFSDTGELIHQEGALLSRFGAVLPQNIRAIGDAVVSWPLAKEYVIPAREHMTLLASGTAVSGGAFSDIELLMSVPGEECWLRLSSMELYYENKRVTGLVFINITEEKQDMMRLLNRAATDPLTNALNRSALTAAVNELAASGSNAVIMLDIDGFKSFNDTFGHIIGDSMLVDIVERLRHGLRREDIIGRIGGDEFMICLRDVSDRAVIERLARHICVLARHSMPNGMYVSASLGIAVSPRDGTRFEELYKKADVAMYDAKRVGGDTFCIYKPDYEQSSLAGEGEDGGISAADDIRSLDCGVLIEFNILNTGFTYPEIMTELFSAEFDSRPLWQIFEENGISSPEYAVKLRTMLEELSLARSSSVRFSEFFLKTADGICRWYRLAFIRASYESKIWITMRDINEEVTSHKRLRHISEYDELTGLLTRTAFTHALRSALKDDPDGAAAGEYSVVYFDIIRFKAINDMFGTAEGDRLLLYIADTISGVSDFSGAATRIDSDRFAFFVKKKGSELEAFIDEIMGSLSRFELAFELMSNAGIYVVTDPELSVEKMLDRAILAQSSVKGNYAVRFAYYTESLRSNMLGEQEIFGLMNTALLEGQFEVYYQPQYDLSNVRLVGAEALVRWNHPDRGLIMPGAFIPIFEKNGFISKLDLYVFESVCSFQKECISSGIRTVPVSVNMTRYDIFENSFIDRMDSIRRRYDVPVELLRIEITESATVGSNFRVNEIIGKLHSLGYIVEMDDFGSGYSSLNVLKDVDMDVLKLDMQFVSDEMRNTRGGTILSSIVRMAKWLGLTVLAEGVETEAQADYLRSIGCIYVQGFYYSVPIRKADYIEKLTSTDISELVPQMNLIETMDAGRFWDPASQETLIFSNYVGAAVIFDLHDGMAEVLRVNRKYLQELGVTNEQDIIYSDILEQFDEENRWVYMGMLQRAIESNDEEECEVWRCGAQCGCGKICVRSNVRIIGKSDGSYIFYETIRNITSERDMLDSIRHRESIFRAASEQINMYYWEYTVATREMRPCFRCIRDLRLPPLVTNYPEPAIEMGIFPPEVADMYREMHRKIEQGVKEQEAIIPLTPDRVPFRVKYTTEFDQDGKPVKAYGSATPVE